MKNISVFDQSPYECRMDWGLHGAISAAGRGDIIILVDVLSFSSAVAAAVHHGAVIYPFPMSGKIADFGRDTGAEVLQGKREAKLSGKPSLSPVSFNRACKGKKYVMSSLNGAACAKASAKVPALFAGSLLNARRTARAAESIRGISKSSITVIACGERINGKPELRPCIEDYLGAGAILNELSGSKSPEAVVCSGAFKSSRSKLRQLVRDCASGRELRAAGFGKDVLFAARLNVIKEVRAITGLGLAEAKGLVEGAPKTVKEGANKEDAEKIKKALEAAGAKVEIK